MPVHLPCVNWRISAKAGLILTALLIGCASEPPAPSPKPAIPPSKLSEKAKQEQQQAILKIRNQTTKQLVRLKPAIQADLNASVGYGVFEINGLNAVLAESHGRGVVIDKRGRATYMQLARTDVAARVTVKPYRQVLVFHDPKRMQQFVEAGSPADVSRDTSIKIYKVDEKGVSIQTDWGARYFRDPDLN